MRKLEKLQPQPLWDYFENICQIPRPSKKEEKIIRFLLDFAEQNKLEAKRDEIGNVLISKPASAGREGAPTVILQSHVDMVCEKNSDRKFNFNTDAILPVLDGGWVKADGTTLGADDGIGIAAQMAVLTSTDIQHGPIECLFTVDEETGLSGAFALKKGFLSGKILLNLDSEDEGEMFIGCAGGIDTLAELKVEKEPVPGNSFAMKIMVKGLMGGHSGDDIHKGRGNANKILTRFLWQAIRDFGVRIADFNGGNLRNAIAREAYAIIIVPSVQKEQLVAELNIFSADVEFEYERTEPNLVVDHSSTVMPDMVLDISSQEKLINMLYACPHGVLEMSTRMEGMVETSTNLASVKFITNDKVLVTTSQRSELESRKQYAAEMVRSVFELAGAQVKNSDGYPGWTPNPESKVLQMVTKSYEKLFGHKPLVRSIHAGLECGLFLEKYPDLDMVSFGPTIRNAHSPDERVNIETVNKFWLHLKDVLENIF
ncbi:MAG: cytosol nonspecific dipeptidase [Bacteroidetes bacterium GWF2_42_66]|nr:MAG: cytosol nonspecific dipeptidase [Bacteroidetes bacterium GWA2_42_15]OFY01034.1 MAG: cytosol nonspecific dipeptidase [Bacteroidetes bacterium GWE2_42_39]OFY41875.1 MAG: cytosol nonspecific dipeptidase [Bacteroidetes bacterium GWF2_42_66]HBL77948.1 cytosol nonspecific dipeptidase [Prolixibacteraceae bacterium]HCR90170.1 cytosol nonspecific dipeptidase [Prolixibacteraceae bacterium]